MQNMGLLEVRYLTEVVGLCMVCVVQSTSEICRLSVRRWQLTILRCISYLLSWVPEDFLGEMSECVSVCGVRERKYLDVVLNDLI